MNKNFKKKIVILLMIAFMVAVLFAAGYVKAATYVNLTIVNMENVNGEAGERPIVGAEFSVYRMSESITTNEQAEQYIVDNNIGCHKENTNSSGKATFSNLLTEGKYYIKQTKIPNGVENAIQPFLIDLPVTNDSGTGWNYNVTLYPKNVLILGKVTLTEMEKNVANGYLVGSTWKLKKYINANWEDYGETYTTNESGKIIVEDLAPGQYKFIEESIADGYVMKWNSNQIFTINSSNLDKRILIERDKADIKKYIISNIKGLGTSDSAYKKDTVMWRTEIITPSVLKELDVVKLTENIDENLELKQGTFKLEYIDSSNSVTTFPSGTYEVSNSDNKVIIDLKLNLINKYIRMIYLTYETNFKDTANFGNYTIESDLTYTKVINENGTRSDTTTVHSEKATVRLGGLAIKKTNQAGSVGLPEAKFKIAESYEDAKANKFIKNSNGSDLTVTTDSNGYAVFDGLKRGDFDDTDENAKTSYWIVEVKAPTGYELLKEPVEVEVNSTSHLTANAVLVSNKGKFVMPSTGGDMTQFISIILSLFIIFISLIVIKIKKKDKTLQIEKKN